VGESVNTKIIKQ